jgi:hypothetical protein
MKTRFTLLTLGIAAVFAVAPATSTFSSPDSAHVRWDIISLTVPATGQPIVSAGGHASANVSPGLSITFTGSGTFVAPGSGGTSSAVTGGGTWETFSGGTATASGTYRVTSLASWQFANFQLNVLVDQIGDPTKRANGNAILRIEYSDGSTGVLGVGCEGPGAPEGIQEGVIATKGYFTYWSAQPPVPGVDANRTTFHILG